MPSILRPLCRLAIRLPTFSVAVLGVGFTLSSGIGTALEIPRMIFGVGLGCDSNYQSCVHNSDCCGGDCQASMCCVVGGGARKNLSACTLNTDCCSDNCYNATTCCAPNTGGNVD